MGSGTRLPQICCVAVWLVACSKPEPAPERTEPWPAPAMSTAKQSRVVAYSLAPNSEVTLTLAAREAKLSGIIRVITGSLKVDLLDLSRTRGWVRVDVASLRILDSDSMVADRHLTAQAHNWLDVGSNQPEAERESKRWAHFTISEIEQTSASAAHEGRRLKNRALPADSEPKLVADGADSGDKPQRAGEIREVRVLARGELSLHGYRVEHLARLRVGFRYLGAAERDKVPSTVTVETRSPLVVPLAAHDIKPRDASGVFLAREVKLFGVRVGRDARVSMRLVARSQD